MKRITGLVLVMGAIMVGIGPNIAPFLDGLSLLFVALFLIGGLLFSDAHIGVALRGVFSADADHGELTEASAAWRQARSYVLAGGTIGTMIGLVVIANNLDTTDWSTVGAALSIGFMTLFQAVVLAFGVCLPCEHYVNSRIRRHAGA